ncbi:MAG: hypothetical protein AMK73_02735 [Planctomycetes bacterium SM23_32]|nr:MAG: hypothetical protein AMK73_02735 [Planctomycetes bacterium SM23_32]
MDTVNVAFVGAGNFARSHHYPTLSRMDDVRVVAIAELNEDLLHETADRYGVPGRYVDYHEMLAREDVDAVYVIMPPHGLRPIVLDVIAAGKHVFTEKPAGMNTAETAEMARAAEQAGVKSAVGCNRRYCHVIRKAKAEVLLEGPISTVLAEFHKDMTGAPFGISVLYTDGLHVLDPMRYILGEAESVHAHADWWYTKDRWEASYNCFQALIRFKGGGSGLFTANRQAGGRYERFEVHGRGISAYVRAPDLVQIVRAGQDEAEVYTGEQLAGSSDERDTYGYFVESREFMDCIKNDAMPPTNFSDNVKTMQLCDMIAAGSHRDMT